MHISKEMLELTLNEILNNDSLETETKDIVRDEFNSNDDTIINNLVLKNLLFFSQFPIVKDIYRSEVFLNQALEFFVPEDTIRLEYFLARIEQNIDLAYFFNQELVLNKIITSQPLLDVIAHQVTPFFDMFEEPTKSRLLEKYFDVEKISLYHLKPFTEEEQQDLLQNEHIRESVYNEILAGGTYSIRKDNENIVYQTYKERFKKLSLKLKTDIFSRFDSEELKKQAILDFNFAKEIANIDSFHFDDIAPYLSQESILSEALLTSNLSDCEKYLKNLTLENQTIVVNNFLERKINIFNDFSFDKLDIEIRKKLYLKYPQSFNKDMLYEMYKKTLDPMYLEEIKKTLLNSDNFNVHDYLYEDAFVRLLSDEEKEQLTTKITITNSISFPSSHVLNYNDYFYKNYLHKLLETTPMRKSFESFDNFNTYLTLEEKQAIMPFIDVNHWLANVLYNEEIFNFFIELLNKNPDYFKGEDFKKYTPSSFVKNELINRLDELLPYFSDEQLIIFFSNSALKQNSHLQEIFKEKAIINLSLIDSEIKLSLFSEEEQKDILMKMDIKSLIGLINMFFEETPKNVVTAIKARIDEYLNYCNSNTFSYMYRMDKVWLMLTKEEKIKLLNNIENIKLLNEILDSLPNNLKEERQLVIKRQLEIFNNDFYGITTDVGEIFSSLSNQKFELKNFTTEELEYLLKQAPIEMLMHIATYYSNDAIKAEIVERIYNSPNCLLNERVLTVLDSFVYSIRGETRKAIETVIDFNLSNDLYYQQQIKVKAKNLTLSDKIKYMTIIQNYSANLGQLTKLLDKNPYVLNTLNVILLDSNISQMGDKFLDKTSKYPILEQKLKIVCLNNPNCASFLVQVSNYLQEHELSEVAYDKKISMIIEYLSHSKNKLKDYKFENVNEENLLDVMNYILYNHANVDIVFVRSTDKMLIADRIEELYEFDIKDFTGTRVSKCDELFKKTQDLDEMKNIYFNKYLSMSLNEAANFHKSYIVNWKKVKDYAMSEAPDKFISLLTKILSINDPITLKELYETTTITYDIGARFTIESIMQKAYYESLANDYQNKQIGSQVTKNIKNKEGNTISLDMTELVDDFGILVHSTCAYGEMPLLDDDYFTSWNNNPNTANHGICCSYITNSSYGTAAVKNTGVMFGFTKLNNSSIATYSPYDLATKNNGYNITSVHTPFYTTLDDIPNYTRHTHNEFDLERRNFSTEIQFSNVQPDCIIIFEDMDESIKANSIKAYEDFKKHGIELKLVYMDKEKIARNEASKLKEYIAGYREIYDLKLLANIINIYESNICGCDFINGLDKNEIFMTKQVRSLINETIDYLTSLKDSSFKVALVQKFISILDNEQAKFDLLDDFNKKRAHTFDLYDDILRKKVQMLSQTIKEEEKERAVYYG